METAKRSNLFSDLNKNGESIEKPASEDMSSVGCIRACQIYVANSALSVSLLDLTVPHMNLNKR